MEKATKYENNIASILIKQLTRIMINETKIYMISTYFVCDFNYIELYIGLLLVHIVRGNTVELNRGICNRIWKCQYFSFDNQVKP